MRPSIRIILVSAILYITTVSFAMAGEVTIPNTFQSGTPAVAADVNANFSAVESAVDDNDNRIAALEATLAALQATVTAQADTIDTLQTRLAAVEGNAAMTLGDYLTVDEASDPRGPLVQLAGVNFQLVNGEGGTGTINGLGNLIIGYDEVTTYDDDEDAICSDGRYTDQVTCVGNNGNWATSHKTGSHYLVLGRGNNYSQYGGLLAGYSNSANSGYATVLGGIQNLASGGYSNVSGGVNNTASGGYSSVSGGLDNTAGDSYSSVSGGHNNTASGGYSSVSGGHNNTAGGGYSSVSGGHNNTAGDSYSSVSGGHNNTASGSSSSISGGAFNTASGSTSSVSGGDDNIASGSYSSVSGGDQREASDTYNWRAGSLVESN